jgi:hypothetical protein
MTLPALIDDAAISASLRRHAEAARGAFAANTERALRFALTHLLVSLRTSPIVTSGGFGAKSARLDSGYPPPWPWPERPPGRLAHYPGDLTATAGFQTSGHGWSGAYHGICGACSAAVARRRKDGASSCRRRQARTATGSSHQAALTLSGLRSPDRSVRFGWTSHPLRSQSPGCSSAGFPSECLSRPCC